MKYIERIPRKISDGLVMVHNHVQPQNQIGLNGFRVWLQPIDETLVVCPCKWAGQLHYRILALWKRSGHERAAKKPVRSFAMR